jgi:hypothetical protein
MPMRPEEIEELMHSANQQTITDTISAEKRTTDDIIPKPGDESL